MDIPNPIVSEATQDRYERALFEYRRAHKELHQAWHALIAEQYASAECADARAQSETET